MHGNMGESIYTKSVSNLVRDIQCNTSLKDSLFEQTQLYFENSNEDATAHLKLQKDIEILEDSLQTADEENLEQVAKKLKSARQQLIKEYAFQEDERNQRLQKLLQVCAKLLILCEAENWQKTQVNSAKLLGTLKLLSPGEGTKLAYQNQKLKPAYRAVVALRLLDRLLEDEKINNHYINERHQANSRYPETEGDLTPFQRNVAIPIIIAALFQDVGSLHPKAQIILKGECGSLDEFRILSREERLALLRINHEQTLNYITYGLGIERYIGNHREERAIFIRNEKKRLSFTRTLLIRALNPKRGLGNLIKVPQIYASVIFSSKPNHRILDLPKAMLIVIKAAERESIRKVVADSLLSILGHFPQGYGITYIPKDDEKKNIDLYEYAIVTGLNPEDPFVPICRLVTRNLTFVANGQLMSIDKKSNLYFAATKKKLEKINPARLEEILLKLVSNFEERKELDIIPSYWNPYGFFGYTKLQNLWKKT
jgi:hypothetical protein